MIINLRATSASWASDVQGCIIAGGGRVVVFGPVLTILEVTRLLMRASFFLSQHYTNLSVAHGIL